MSETKVAAGSILANIGGTLVSGTNVIGRVGIDQSTGQNVIALSPRSCVSHQDIIVPATIGVTLASLCSGGIIPVGAVTAEIQTKNGVVCYKLDASTVTPTTGKRINVDEDKVIDSDLTKVRVVAESTTVTCSVSFYDRV
jgi:hypothetical protein